jgi:ribonuclease-3
VEISVQGPPHERRFTCAAIIDDEELGRGQGRTKKAAEQEAAREALSKLDTGDAGQV